MQTNKLKILGKDRY